MKIVHLIIITLSTLANPSIAEEPWQVLDDTIKKLPPEDLVIKHREVQSYSFSTNLSYQEIENKLNSTILDKKAWNKVQSYGPEDGKWRSAKFSNRDSSDLICIEYKRNKTTALVQIQYVVFTTIQKGKRRWGHTRLLPEE
jgi:hypothetical protein